MDAWQRPVADFGLTGPDQGEGGGYLLIGPSEDPSRHDADGRMVIQSATNNMTTKRDSKGDLLRADRTYRLHVPAPVPVAQFWSLTLYSENTRRPYDNGGTDQRSVNLDSRDQTLTANPDGSIDLYVGPEPPTG